MVEFRVLGPLDVVVDGDAVRLPAGKPRALLADLLLHRNRVVSVRDLIDELWGDDPPETATSALQVYVSQLRKAIGPDRVFTKAPGYSLRVEEGELDLDRFERLVDVGGEGPLREALGLWRGPALAEFGASPFLREAGERLEESRLAALELRIDADLALDRHVQLVPELEELIARAPFRERFRAQLMVALYRSGRQADALELYRRTRQTFVDELGIEPSPELQELERSILRHDDDLQPPAAVRPVPSVPPGSRRRRLAIAAGLVGVPALALAVMILALGDGSSAPRSDHELRTYVARIENFLDQSRDGRREVTTSIDAAFHCRLSPSEAVEHLNRVERNRQSLLQQVAALTVPDSGEARETSDLFQKAVQASIAADWHYRDWFRSRRACGPPDQSAELRAALAADRRATLAKRSFVASFNPLARRVGEREWSAADF